MSAPISGPWSRRLPALAGPVLLLMMLTAVWGLTGCASMRSQTAAETPTEQITEARSDEEAQAPGLELYLDSVESWDCVAEGPEPFEQNQREDPLTESPLDDLATVEPELTPEAVERERDLVASQAPTYDIPIVLNEKVLAWVDVYSNRLKPHFENGLARSGRYNEMFRQIFADRGLPQDLVYMAAVESGYKTSAYSRAHARGIFQFIAATGRRYGLRVDYWVDERSDPEKSARAAAAYMDDLYEEFGDWYLALAAYNAGEGTVRRAIRKTGSRDFWELAKSRYLRRETKNHVPAILAATVLYKDPEKYGLSYVPKAPLQYDTVTVDGAADLRVLARCVDVDVMTLKELNPALRRNQTPPEGSTEFRVPPGTGETTRAALEAIPVNERVLYARYRVERGDTLSQIARRQGVTVAAIQGSNQMGRRTLIREKQILLIPTSASTRYGDIPLPEASNGTEALTYRVQRGDTLYGIARRYRTTPAAIAAASDISVNKVLQIGEHLRIARGVSSPSQARDLIKGGSTHVASAGTSKAASGQALVHTVRRGDSLYWIAKRNRTTPAAIAAASDISVNRVLQIGERLNVVPGVTSAAEARSIVEAGTTRVASANSSRGGGGGGALVHTVRSGDTLWHLAQRYDTSVDDLCAWNMISPRTVIRPGRRLTVGFK